MWYIVIITYYKHWNSEYGTTIGVPVYSTDPYKAVELTTDEYSAVSTHQVIECGQCKPKVVYND